MSNEITLSALHANRESKTSGAACEDVRNEHCYQSLLSNVDGDVGDGVFYCAHGTDTVDVAVVSVGFAAIAVDIRQNNIDSSGDTDSYSLISIACSNKIGHERLVAVMSIALCTFTFIPYTNCTAFSISFRKHSTRYSL